MILSVQRPLDAVTNIPAMAKHCKNLQIRYEIEV